MNNHTQAQLHTVYGVSLPDDIFKFYCDANPLKLDLNEQKSADTYWECVNRFLTTIHSVLLDPAHELSIGNIMTENYYFLAKVCVDRSFDVGDLIKIRNDRKIKHNKNLANQISHHVLPFYITNLYKRVKESDHRPHTMVQTPVKPVINPTTGMPLPPPMQMPYQAFHPFQMPFQHFQPFQQFPPFQPFQQFQMPFQMQPQFQQAFQLQPNISVKQVSESCSDAPRKPHLPRPNVRTKKPRLISHSTAKKPTQESELAPLLIPTDTDLPSTVYDCYKPSFSRTNSPLLPVDVAEQPSTIPNPNS